MKTSIVLAYIVFLVAFVMDISTLFAATFTPLGDLPGGNFDSFALAISADGSSVVGESQSINGNEAFIWNATDGMIGLGDLPGGIFQSRAKAISRDGSIVVGHSRSAMGTESFLWEASNGIGGLSGFSGGVVNNTANGISGDGSKVVGLDKLTGEAFIWDASNGISGLEFLPGGFGSNAMAISDDGSTVVGESKSPASIFGQAVIWDASGTIALLGDFPGGRTESLAVAVSANGSSVVGWGTTSSGIEAFIWDVTNGLTGLGTLPVMGSQSFAQDISGDGSIVVGTSGPVTGREAFIWDAGNGIQRLADVLAASGVDMTGWTLSEATGISSDGKIIAGRGTNPSGQREAWVVNLAFVVPEPSAFTCSFVIFLLATGCRMRRQP